MESTNNQICKACVKIACKECPWVASDEEVSAIQQGKLTSCPQCGWVPPKATS